MGISSAAPVDRMAYTALQTTVALLLYFITFAVAGLGPNITNEANALLASTASSANATSSTTPTSASVSGTDTAATPSSTNNNNGGQAGGSGSPLLFFVALGFGVVFTNLWIIVGVKYCFRYNHRHRARLAEAEADALEMGNQNRPHRRRREKKLMSMEEVNERFPLLKYKTWRATRESEGLPAAGGVAMPASRPATIHESEGVVPLTSDEAEKIDSPSIGASEITTSTPAASKNHDDSTAIAPVDSAKDATSPAEMPTEITEQGTDEPKPVVPNRPISDPLPTVPDDEVDEDADHIGHNADVDMTVPGDTCAICIDNLEDDDDVRGLTCGHAFHGSCLDPWMTSRRACCPLCKADFYVPKPRTEVETTPDALASADRRTRGMQINPSTWRERGRGNQNRPLWRPRGVMRGGVLTPVFVAHDRYGFPVIRRVRRTGVDAGQQELEGPTASIDAPQEQQHPGGQHPRPRTWRDRIGMPLRSSRAAPPINTTNSTTGRSEQPSAGAPPPPTAPEISTEPALPSVEVLRQPPPTTST